MKWVQKGVLTVRSAFEHCVEAELEKQGFGKARIIKYSGVGICVITLFLLMFYFAMDSANAFGVPRTCCIVFKLRLVGTRCNGSYGFIRLVSSCSFVHEHGQEESRYVLE